MLTNVNPKNLADESIPLKSTTVYENDLVLIGRIDYYNKENDFRFFEIYLGMKDSDGDVDELIPIVQAK